MDAIEYFKGMRERLCETYLKAIPKDSVGYQATLIEKSFYDEAIKALERKPCEDAISRQAVLDLCERFDGCVPYSVLFNHDMLPSVSTEKTGRWIPVSEKLPEVGEYDGDVAKYYLVQNEYGDMMVARYTHSGYWEQMYQLKPIGDQIVAWMPLPKPYKEESEG